jgi:hypothetical protein
MGTKNRIYLGKLSKYFLHKVRFFETSELYITDNKIKKIKSNNNRLNLIDYLNKEDFCNLIDNVIYVSYDKEENIYNCLTKIDEKFVIFGIVSKNLRNEITTLFYTNERQIKNKFLNKENLIVLKKEDFTTN